MAEGNQVSQLHALAGLVDDEILKVAFSELIFHDLAGCHRQCCTQNLRILDYLSLNLLLLFLCRPKELVMLGALLARDCMLALEVFEFFDQCTAYVHVQELIHVLILVQQWLDQADQSAAVGGAILDCLDCFVALVENANLLHLVTLICISNTSLGLFLLFLHPLLVILDRLDALLDFVVECHLPDLLQRLIVHSPYSDNPSFRNPTPSSGHELTGSRSGSRLLLVSEQSHLSLHLKECKQGSSCADCLPAC